VRVGAKLAKIGIHAIYFSEEDRLQCARMEGRLVDHALRSMSVVDWISPVVVAVVFVFLVSLIKEPARQKFNAILVGGAGAAYLNGGFGAWELVLPVLSTWIGYRGLESYRFIGAGWLLHTAWDIAHHFWGQPILAFQATSSAGCAITDALIAMWFFAGAPSVYGVRRGRAVAPAAAR
jgi:hypothetical protein